MLIKTVCAVVFVAAAMVPVGGADGGRGDSASDAGKAPVGPPTLCHPIEIGDAKSLPWSERNETVGYKPFERVGTDGRGRETVRLIVEVMELLGPGTDGFVRMETLRRAAMYPHGMSGKEKPPEWVADRLMSDVLTRALDAEAGLVKAPTELAWLDAAWLCACYADLHDHGSTRQYGWLIKGAKGGGGRDAAFEFAGAVMTWHAKGMGRAQLAGLHAGHVRAAAKAAKEGSLLEKNLLSRFGGDGITLKTLRGE